MRHLDDVSCLQLFSFKLKLRISNFLLGQREIRHPSWDTKSEQSFLTYQEASFFSRCKCLPLADS